MKENKATDRFYGTDINLEDISEIKNNPNDKLKYKDSKP